MKQLKVILVGAGNRGRTYCRYMKNMPEKYKVVGVAEPHELRRAEFAKEHGIPVENCFESWEGLLSRPKMADIAVIATNDDAHFEPAMKAIALGYDILLEKPVAQTAEECAAIANAAKAKGVRVLVCHVLRYTSFYKALKSVVESGMIGEVMSLDQIEAIGDVHFSHSFIRGNWHDSVETTPIVLAKTCHDLDIIQWLVGKKCKKVSSFGELTYFKAENAPAGAPVRCAAEDCPERGKCPYDSLKIYIDNPDGLCWKGGFRNAVATHPNYTDAELLEALKRTDYGLCVFHANNNMPDHQVVSMSFEGGATAQLTLNAFNRGGRYTRIYGTKGEVYAFASDEEIVVRTFADRKKHVISLNKVDETITGGHGGGDYGIIYDMYDYLCGTYEGNNAAEIGVSVQNHMIGFAAEKARLTDTVVDIGAFCEKLGLEY